MINEKCNLRCPYCFANEFTLDKVTKNMSLEDFEYALNFALSSGASRIGIIGGEPTLHPQFKEIMEMVIKDNRVQRVTLFTNGTQLDKYINLLIPEKVTALINYNSKEDIGERNFEKINENLDKLHNEYYLGHKITLGINMYKPNFEFKYMIDALAKYGKRTVRTSISMPMNVRELDPLEHMHQMKPSVFRFFQALERIGVIPRYDCNIMPPCVMSENEVRWLDGFYRMGLTNEPTNILDKPNCCPVIDITVDLLAVRCFALSKETKVDIRQFRNVAELYSFFYNQIDSYKYIVPASEKCKTCALAKKGLCTGGCIAYKINKIGIIKDEIEARLYEEGV